MKDVTIEPFTEVLEFENGKELWTWLIWSNAVAEMVLGELNLAVIETKAIQQALQKMIRECAGSSESAALTVPINIGIGTK